MSLMSGEDRKLVNRISSDAFSSPGILICNLEFIVFFSWRFMINLQESK